MRNLFGFPLFLLLVGTAFGQQIGSVDLTRLPGHEALPKGCKELVPGAIGDGWPEPEDHVARDITVLVVRVKDAKPTLGAALIAEVRLQNSGTSSIEIPWNTESSAIEKGQNPDARTWDEGTFEFTMKDQEGHEVSLKSLTGSVYGSKYSVGSELTIKPGESVTALVKLKIEDQFAIPPWRLKEGAWQLSATWVQTGREWYVRNCEATSAYFHYDRFYQQQNPGITIQINAGGPTTNRKVAE